VREKLIGSQEGKLAVLWILLGIGLRLLPHPPNFTPIGALAIFGGAYLTKRYALVLPLLCLVLSDLVLGFHRTIPFTWGMILVAGLLGMWTRSRRNYGTLVGAGVVHSILFFVFANLGVWLVGGLYPHTWEGLLTCYTRAIPFYRNTLAGNLVYLTILVGTFEGAFRLFRLPRTA